MEEKQTIIRRALADAAQRVRDYADHEYYSTLTKMEEGRCSVREMQYRMGKEKAFEEVIQLLEEGID